MNIVILAGGQGTRLWPMSRKKKPKQFYNILSDQPMIVDVYNRLKGQYSDDKIFISTHEKFADHIHALLPSLSEDQYIIEPSKRDSGPAMAYAAHELFERGKGDEPMAFVPTDHYISDDERFLTALKVADQLIKDTGKMLDISVTPQFPSIALGYTQIGEKYQTKDGVDVFHFLGHKEKPDVETAQKYIESGQYLWHANYYMWTPAKFLAAFEQYAPDIHQILQRIARAGSDQEKRDIYNDMPTIMIDYAVTEKMDPEEVLIIRGDFGWSDIGAWNVLYDRMNFTDQSTNIVSKGKVITIDTHNCLIYSKDDKVIATIGLQDLVIIDTDDALLICPQSRSQEVKKIVEKIKEEGLEEFL